MQILLPKLPYISVGTFEFCWLWVDTFSSALHTLICICLLGGLALLLLAWWVCNAPTQWSHQMISCYACWPFRPLLPCPMVASSTKYHKHCSVPLAIIKQTLGSQLPIQCSHHASRIMDTANFHQPPTKFLINCCSKHEYHNQCSLSLSINKLTLHLGGSLDRWRRPREETRMVPQFRLLPFYTTLILPSNDTAVVDHPLFLLLNAVNQYSKY